MAWDWLDAARYADTNGYQGDGERTMWPWRDWVVKAFNDNMPFDQFTVVAARRRPAAEGDARADSSRPAFNRNHMINGEGGRIAEENRVEYVFDQTETTGDRLARPHGRLLPAATTTSSTRSRRRTTTRCSRTSTRRR